jgi:ribosomal protein L28
MRVLTKVLRTVEKLGRMDQLRPALLKKES